MPTPRPPEIETVLSRDDALEKLKRHAARLRISPGDIMVRPVPGSPAGMAITITLAGKQLTKQCTSQPTKDKNFYCLVLWLGDLIRNIERGIETVNEAFYNEGGRDLVLREPLHEDIENNPYQGTATREDSRATLIRAFERLGVGPSDYKMSWDEPTGVAELKFRLRSDRIVAKTSRRQKSLDHNIHVLALWVQTKAKNYERGLEPDLDTLFAANLLPA